MILRLRTYLCIHYYICIDEKFRIYQDELKTASFDILIADEGHKLKNSDCKISQGFVKYFLRFLLLV